MPKGNREFGKAEANFPGLRLSDKNKLDAVMNSQYGGGKSLMDLQMTNAQNTEDDLRPSMKQDSHPDHNMPTPEHDGTMLK